MYKIGAVTKQTGLSADTLRYYEKFGLLPNISRNESGFRLYNDKDISRLKFIKRAQHMNFTLEEIRHLIVMRENPQKAKDNVRQLTADKLKDLETKVAELTLLRNELQLLLNLCRGDENGCPIIEGMEDNGHPAG
ncbi:MAG: Cu(I)-responsive transcriptional regulator [Gammaproteobacteria bacterium]|nr:MAG: Cu(I)-responsive transcriptional regulator [Gammaproteobacteria bacterium]